jgi:hypothetical protein
MMRRTTVALAGSAVLGAVLGLSAFAAPAAAACDPPQDVTVPGAEAHWTECHNGGGTQVNGWVKDTNADGKCAQVYAEFSSGGRQESLRACPANNVKTFDFNEPGASDAQTYLRTMG